LGVLLFALSLSVIAAVVFGVLLAFKDPALMRAHR
jgi:hypothetical protein